MTLWILYANSDKPDMPLIGTYATNMTAFERKIVCMLQPQISDYLDELCGCNCFLFYTCDHCLTPNTAVTFKLTKTTQATLEG